MKFFFFPLFMLFVFAWMACAPELINKKVYLSAVGEKIFVAPIDFSKLNFGKIPSFPTDAKLKSVLENDAAFGFKRTDYGDMYKIRRQ